MDPFLTKNSYAAFSYATVDRYLSNDPTDSSLVWATKKGAIHLAAPVLIVAAVVESVIAHSLFGLAKGVRTFLSNKHSNVVKYHWMLPAYDSARASTEFTALTIGSYFLSKKNNFEMGQSIRRFYIRNFGHMVEPWA